MANTPQAKKRIRRNDRRAEINGARVSRLRTFVKQVEAALESGDKAQAEAAIRKVQPELARDIDDASRAGDLDHVGVTTGLGDGRGIHEACVGSHDVPPN